MIDGCIKLSGGRTLGFAEFGQTDGHPIFVFHGTPGSRFHLFSHLATKITQGNIRIIAPERPGYGLSDPKPDRTILDWAGDVQQLADHLGIERFSLVGISGGCPHAIACAYAMPHRVVKAAVICGIGPLDVPGALVNASAEIQMCVGDGERLTAYTNQLVGMVQADPDAIVTYFLGHLTESDRKLITEDMIPIFRDFAMEAARRTDGMIDDYRLLAKPWGIPLTEIQVLIHLWHSDSDESVPLSHAQYLTGRIPNAVLHNVTGVGHSGTPLISCDAVLRFLTD